MARGQKKGIRITNRALAKERKKIKETPKRGRWPKFEDILDVEDYVKMYKFPHITFKHPKYGNICFGKELSRGDNVLDSDFGVPLPDKYKIIAAVRFYCTSYNGNEGWILDTCCKHAGVYKKTVPVKNQIGCTRTSCPYYDKGFIETTLNSKTFADNIENMMNKAHNDAIDNKND